jgi:hypothetical protein
MYNRENKLLFLTKSNCLYNLKKMATGDIGPHGKNVLMFHAPKQRLG